jgi:hypothetical protein
MIGEFGSTIVFDAESVSFSERIEGIVTDSELIIE